MSEDELIYECKQQNPRAQNELFNLYYNDLIKVARKYSKNNHDAEDIVQDALTNIMTRIHQYSGKGCFEGWMKRVTINMASVKYRKVTESKTIYGEIYEENSLKFSGERIQSNISYKELLKLVEKLPKGYKKVFNLHAVEGFSHEEISEIMGIRSSSSRSQYLKARRYLQQLIKHEN